jgi:hypothetical protein
MLELVAAKVAVEQIFLCMLWLSPINYYPTSVPYSFITHNQELLQ